MSPADAHRVHWPTDELPTRPLVVWRGSRGTGIRERRYIPEAEVERLRELAATATRAHTRAIHALAGNCDYPEADRHEMGAYLMQELQDNGLLSHE